MSNGLDYAFIPHPPLSAITAGGYRFAGRYASSYGPNDTNGKNLTPAECAALLGAGLQIIIFAEEDAGWMLGGRDAGIAAARHLDAVAQDLGIPGIPGYYAADWDVAVGEQGAVNACLDGAASVRGRARTGIYGGFYAVNRALNGGHARYAAQTYAWSGYTLAVGQPDKDHRGRALFTGHAAQWVTPGMALPAHAVIVTSVAGRTLPGRFLFDDRAQLRQGVGGYLGGGSVDFDQAMMADFGQWPRPVPPQPPAQEEEPMQLNSGPGAETIARFPNGAHTYIGFVNDAARTNSPAPKLRIAVHGEVKGWRVKHVVLTRSDDDHVHFTDVLGDTEPANGVSVVRDGQGDDVPVGFNLG